MKGHMSFRIGQKVVCIHHVPLDERLSHCVYVEKGGIYTIRGIYFQADRKLLLLQEIHNPMWSGGDEYGFNAKGFRPIVDRKTDITIFTKMLTGVDA
jgi:hypothetical protein